MMYRFILVCALLTVPLPAIASDIAVSRFSSEGLTGWDVKEFKGRTTYTLVKDQGKTVVKAHAKASASGLVKKISFDPREHRYLSWSWKVPTIINGGNERTKTGDDYAARVYVVFPGKFFWQMRALNYIWANNLPKGQFVPNAFTANAMLVAVESGNAKTGQWIHERRDILADYRMVFGEDPPKAGAIAIMTDTDNTGGNAEAWYGEIMLSGTP